MTEFSASIMSFLYSSEKLLNMVDSKNRAVMRIADSVSDSRSIAKEEGGSRLDSYRFFMVADFFAFSEKER